LNPMNSFGVVIVLADRTETEKKANKTGNKTESLIDFRMFSLLSPNLCFCLRIRVFFLPNRACIAQGSLTVKRNAPFFAMS
jgi:hypothetical protein